MYSRGVGFLKTEVKLDMLQNTVACIFLFSYFVDFMTAPKSISIVLLLAFSIYNFKNINIEQLIHSMSQEYKKSIILLLLFIFLIFILSFFNSSGYLIDSLKSLQKDTFPALVFLVWSISFKSKIDYKAIIYSLAIAVCANNVYFTFDEHALETFVVSRKYSALAPMIFPFLLVAIYFAKNNILRIFLALNIFYCIVLVAASGARSGYYTLLIEFCLCGVVFLLTLKRNRRLMVALFLLLTSISIAVFATLAYHSDTFKKSLEKYASPSGRVEIVRHRLPIFIDNGNLLTGFGHADVAYQIFFKKYNAPLDYTNIHEGVLQYNSDEPYILRVLYNYGIFGMLLYVWILFFIGKSTYLGFVKRINFAALPILISMFAYFILRGTVENLNLKFVLALFAIAITFMQEIKDGGNV